MKIHKGDQVLIISGKDRKRKGKVIKVLPQKSKIVVEGMNIVKKHIRPKKQGEKGQIVETSAPIDVSNIKLICPKCGKAARIGYKIISNIKNKKSKSRICKRCGQEI